MLPTAPFVPVLSLAWHSFLSLVATPLIFLQLPLALAWGWVYVFGGGSHRSADGPLRAGFLLRFRYLAGFRPNGMRKTQVTFG